MNTYKVSVDFTLHAPDVDTAWETMIHELVQMERHDQLPDWVVNQPVEITHNVDTQLTFEGIV